MHLAVTLPNPRTLSHNTSFIPRTSQLWNSLPPTTSLNPTICHLLNLTSTNLILSPFLLKLSLIFSVFPLSGLCYRPYGLSLTLLTEKQKRSHFIFGSTYETTEKHQLEPQSRCSLVQHWLISFGRAIAEPML